MPWFSASAMGFLCHEVFVDELFRFLFGENVPRFGDGHTFFLFLRWHDVFHHIVHIIHDLVHAGCGEHVVGHVLFFNLDLDDLVVKFVAAQLFLEDHLLVVAAPFFFGIGGAVALLLCAEEHLERIVPAALLFLGRHEDIDEPLCRELLRFALHGFDLFSAHQTDRRFHEIAHHALDIAADVADTR